MAFDNFYYNEQIKRYLIQFMAIFSGMRCQIGKRDDEEEQTISVPIHYGNADRVVSSILAANTQNKLLRLPVMSAVLTGFDMAPELRKGIGQERRDTYLPQGGVFPDDIKKVVQLMPIPYWARADVSVYTSNIEQRFQIIEQIMMLFDPIVQIQTTDALFDWTKLTTVELENIGLDDNYPTGTDRRILVITFSFKFPIYISAPANLKSDYIKDIYVRLGTIDQVANSSEEIIGDLEGQGLDYEKWFTLDDVNL